MAEIGVNWDGNFDLLHDMMMASKNAGCNAIKLQAFLENMVKNHPESTRLIKTSVTKENVSAINDLAKKVDIEWFSTPFYPEAVDFLDPYVKRFKIRVADGEPLLKNTKSPLIERVLQTKKEVIVSCQKNPRNSKYYGDSQIKWLYCVSKYPCSFEDLDFTEINEYDGFSNHCPQIIAPLTAAILGAKIVEVHITSSKDKNYVDNNVSFDYNELDNLVKFIKQSEKLKK